MKKIVVTSALPYANGPIHLGHLVEYIQTDIYVRFLKLIGEDVIYCCADDTHGTPMEIEAKKQGITPEELIEKMHKAHLKDFTDFHIHFDSYYSTNSKENKEYSDLIFTRLKEKNYIYTKEVEQTFCENCNRFLPDRFVKGKCPKCKAEDQYGDVCEKCNSTYNTPDLIEPYCSICHKTPTRKTSSHYFFKLSNFSDKLKKWLTENDILQPEVKNYVLNWIEDGLKDWDISRDGPYFGFKIPGEENKYYYVWLDAPIGYIASTKNYCNLNNKKIEDYWFTNNSKIIHFIGKDIIYFHCLFWPAILMGSDIKLPDQIIVHGYLTINGEKMSKSRGTFITARQFLDHYNPEYLRYYYARSLSKKLADINLDFKDIKDIINGELMANFGNFCNRVITFANKNFDGKFEDIDTSQKEMILEIEQLFKKTKEDYENINLNQVVKNIMTISSLGNKYLQDSEPWKKIKENREEACRIIGFCINIVKCLSILISPILPNISKELQKQINLSHLTWNDLGFNLKNHKIGEAQILIKPLDKVEDLTQPIFSTDHIPHSKFVANLKVGKVLSIEDHPQAEKLYILLVDIGAEKRQLVAGLRGKVPKEELFGKNIIIVANLKPVKLRGVDSYGMLLAAEKSGKIVPLSVQESLPGTDVFPEGIVSLKDEIDIKTFSQIPFEVKEKRVFVFGKILKTDFEEIIADIEDGAEVK